jgi:endonuclease YncB( thermonuclease family)
MNKFHTPHDPHLKPPARTSSRGASLVLTGALVLAGVAQLSGAQPGAQARQAAPASAAASASGAQGPWSAAKTSEQKMAVALAPLYADLEQRRIDIANGARFDEWVDRGVAGPVVSGEQLMVRANKRGNVVVRVAGIVPTMDEQAKRFTRDFVNAGAFNLDCRTIDGFGRAVCEISRGGKDLGEEMLKLGLARQESSYAYDQRPARRALYTKLESQAREQRVGMWPQTLQYLEFSKRNWTATGMVEALPPPPTNFAPRPAK